MRGEKERTASKPWNLHPITTQIQETFAGELRWRSLLQFCISWPTLKAVRQAVNSVINLSCGEGLYCIILSIPLRKTAPGLHTFVQLVTTWPIKRAGDVLVKILLDHVVYFWKHDLGHFQDTSCGFSTIPPYSFTRQESIHLHCNLLRAFSPTA